MKILSGWRKTVAAGLFGLAALVSSGCDEIKSIFGGSTPPPIPITKVTPKELAGNSEDMEIQIIHSNIQNPTTGAVDRDIEIYRNGILEPFIEDPAYSHTFKGTIPGTDLAVFVKQSNTDSEDKDVAVHNLVTKVLEYETNTPDFAEDVSAITAKYIVMPGLDKINRNTVLHFLKNNSWELTNDALNPIAETSSMVKGDLVAGHSTYAATPTTYTTDFFLVDLTQDTIQPEFPGGEMAEHRISDDLSKVVACSYGKNAAGNSIRILHLIDRSNGNTVTNDVFSGEDTHCVTCSSKGDILAIDDRVVRFYDHIAGVISDLNGLQNVSRAEFTPDENNVVCIADGKPHVFDIITRVAYDLNAVLGGNVEYVGCTSNSELVVNVESSPSRIVLFDPSNGLEQQLLVDPSATSEKAYFLSENREKLSCGSDGKLSEYDFPTQTPTVTGTDVSNNPPSAYTDQRKTRFGVGALKKLLVWNGQGDENLVSEGDKLEVLAAREERDKIVFLKEIGDDAQLARYSALTKVLEVIADYKK